MGESLKTQKRSRFSIKEIERFVLNQQEGVMQFRNVYIFKNLYLSSLTKYILFLHIYRKAFQNRCILTTVKL